MTDEAITAMWARQQTQRNIQDEIDKQLINCESAILNAVEKRKYSTQVDGILLKDTITILEGRGFHVKQHSERNEDWVVIHWNY
jgi:hypothetical protein